MANHTQLIKRGLIPYIMSGRKTIDVRVGWNSVKAIQAGDTITFQSGRAEVTVSVLEVRLYSDFDSAIGAEDAEQIFPGYGAHQIIRSLRDIYPEDKEAKGVYVFLIKYTRPPLP